MSNIVKIIILAIIFILIVFMSFLFLIPGIRNSTGKADTLSNEEENYRILIDEMDRFEELIENSNQIKVKNEILSLKLPYKHDITLLTNELYEIARVSEVQINTINHVEITIGDSDGNKKNPISIFETDVVIQGSYVNILNFIYTLEIMPRISIIENIIIQADNEDHEILSLFITFRSYYITGEI